MFELQWPEAHSAAAMHELPLFFSHAPKPSQAKVHLFFGSLPFSMAAQVPSAPLVSAAAHDSQSPLQATSQHMPSTQWPEEHCLSLVQVWPLLSAGLQISLSQ